MDAIADVRPHENIKLGYAIDRIWPLLTNTDTFDSDAVPDIVVNVLSVAAYQLLARARQLSIGNATDRQLAIVFAVSACEMHTEQALTRLLKKKGSRLRDISALVGHPNSLENPHFQKVYSALTQDMPWGDLSADHPPARWWKAWITSRNLKQDVTRDGRLISKQEAALCIKTSVSYVAHLSDAVSKVLTEL